MIRVHFEEAMACEFRLVTSAFHSLSTKRISLGKPRFDLLLHDGVVGSRAEDIKPGT